LAHQQRADTLRDLSASILFRSTLIDLHCHILPGIDDGPPTVEDSVALGRVLADAGVSTVAATPHLREDHPDVLPAELAERCDALAGEFAKTGVGLKVVAAGELDLLWALEASPEQLRLASYGQRGADLLLETPYGPLPPHFKELLESPALAGYRILLAHPERSPTFQSEPDRLAELVLGGRLVQITTGSLARSPRRSRSARLAHHLLREGLVHVIASDAHSAGGSPRAPEWNAIETARALVGPRADWMVEAAPRAILDGTPLPPPPPAGGGKARRWWRRGRPLRQRS
jgi:protein-tyrosine phosphatase